MFDLFKFGRFNQEDQPNPETGTATHSCPWCGPGVLHPPANQEISEDWADYGFGWM